MKITDEELKKISSAVKKAESRTSGEIVTAVIKESSDYAFYELAFALVLGGIYFVLSILFAGKLESWLESLFWSYNTTYLITFTGFSLFGVIGIGYLLANIPFIDRLIIPKKVMDERVHNRALRHFIESGASYTIDRTGILIFVSVLERKVILLADKGINDKLSSDTWDRIVKSTVSGIKEGKFTEAIINAVNECGSILEKDFPIKKDDKNELSDDIQVLKR